jgi:predicted Zn-dependent protease
LKLPKLSLKTDCDIQQRVRRREKRGRKAERKHQKGKERENESKKGRERREKQYGSATDHMLLWG